MRPLPKVPVLRKGRSAVVILAAALFAGKSHTCGSWSKGKFFTGESAATVYLPLFFVSLSIFLKFSLISGVTGKRSLYAAGMAAGMTETKPAPFFTCWAILSMFSLEMELIWNPARMMTSYFFLRASPR